MKLKRTICLALVAACALLWGCGDGAKDKYYEYDYEPVHQSDSRKLAFYSSDADVDYINVWCPKAMLYTTEEDYLTVDNAKPPFVEAWQEEIHGNLHRFMQNQEKGGDTLWWYTCWDPTAPYITLNTEEKGVNHRILFWQQKYFGVKGFLYFSVTEWDAGSDSWTSHEKANSEQNTVWGDGQLIYSGSPLGLDTPVASLRLNSVRDGIEDYEYLTMLERTVGAGKVQELISKVTTSVVKYTSDEDFFATYRVRLGNYLESALKGV